VQADATSAAFISTIMQDNVILTLVYVHQAQAFGLKTGACKPWYAFPRKFPIGDYLVR
jgi:hypothetical protein